MKASEHAVLMAATGDMRPLLEVRSTTRVDAGSWWRRTPLWVCVTDSDVVILAVGRRHYVQRFSIDDCQHSHYCHTTGQLVIEAGEELMFSRLAMSPADGLRVLHAINASNTQHTQD